MATHATHHLAGIVGANITDARNRRGLTQHELATALDTSISRVSGWETGKHLPRNPQAVADQLFDGDITALFRQGEPEEAVA